jgi:hypothetical protein
MGMFEPALRACQNLYITSFEPIGRQQSDESFEELARLANRDPGVASVEVEACR